MNFKMKTGEEFTIQTKGGYTLTAPDKTGTLATTDDVPDESGKENTSNKVTSLSSLSTDAEYPSAKCVYDALSAATPDISTNVVSDKASDLKASSPRSVYDFVYPAVGTTQPSGGMLPNVYYFLGTLSGNTTFTLAAPSDANILNHYYWTFETGSTAPTITWPSSVTSWVGGSAPSIGGSKHYEISVINGIGAYMEA